MLRGESKRELGTTHWLYQSFKSELFQEMECKDREVLKVITHILMPLRSNMIYL